MHSGGLTHLRSVADLAALYHVQMGCHGPTDLSPVSMAAALHFDLSIQNFGIQEYMQHSDRRTKCFRTAIRFMRGICIREMLRGWAWISMRSWRRSFHTSERICR